ncbi:hypothetical protein D3C72_172390 [compost metagenome]
MNGTGIFSTTAGKFESKAGQHLFMGSATVNMPAIDLPDCSAKQTQAAQNGSAKVDLS